MTDDETDNDETERELRRAADLLDPVPERLVPMAVTAFAWRTIDADLAELIFDSLAESAPVSVRGPDQPRLLTFRAGELIIELELAAEGTTLRLVGRVAPAGPAEVEVRHRRGAVTVTADPLGRFAVGGLAPGALSLRCRPAGAASAVVTDWVTA
jgi:hypothetical protein